MKIFANVFFAFALAAQALAAGAAEFPDKAVRIVVPFPAGGAADTFTRLIGQKLTSIWAQPVIVENKPGAGTVIGTAAVAKAAPDGYTLLIIANSFLINDKLQKELPYDGVKAFAPVAMLLNSPQVLAVNAESPYMTFAQLLARSREPGANLSYSTVGPNTSQNIGGELLKARTGMAATYVPFAGGAMAGNAVMGGHVTMVLTNWNEIATNIRAGKLRPLAVTTRERIEPLKDTPTLVELGYPEVDVDVWFGVAAPRGTPDAVLDKLAAGFKQALSDPEVRKQLIAAGFYPDFQGRVEFARKIASQSQFLYKIIDELKIKAE